MASKEAPADHHWSYLVLRRWAGWTKRYLGRIVVWARLLSTVKGASLRDTLVMCLSACAAPVFAFRKLDEWQNPILLADCKVEVAGVGRFHLSAGTDELYLVFPGRESAIMDFVAQNLKMGDTFVDVGANIGFYSIYAGQRIGEDGQVVCFEMMPATCSRLRRNLALNQLEEVSKIVGVPLASSIGKDVIARMARQSPGQASIVRTCLFTDYEVALQTSTLDLQLAMVATVKIMKIDVEGAELAVLQGAAETLRKCEFVIYESLAKFESTNRAVEALLKDAGFKTEQLDRSNRLAIRLTS